MIKTDRLDVGVDARRSYSLVRAPHAASAAHSGSSKGGWSSSTSNVIVNRYARFLLTLTAVIIAREVGELE
jgi:hypothetical protein